MTHTCAQILTLSDAGKHPDEIAAALTLSPSTVYTVLRTQRPDRKRKPRAVTSELPCRIRWLAGRGHKPARIAVMLQVSRAYIYRVLAAKESK